MKVDSYLVDQLAELDKQVQMRQEVLNNLDLKDPTKKQVHCQNYSIQIGAKDDGLETQAKKKLTKRKTQTIAE